MEIRTETLNDYDEVFHLNYLAFNHREDESKLIERIRASEQFVPELSLVAEEMERLLATLCLAKQKLLITKTATKVIVLAPIAVLPVEQKKGIGGKLIHEGLKRSKALGYSYVFLIGHPAITQNSDLNQRGDYGLFDLKQFHVPDEVFMVYELTEGPRIKGELRYPSSFFHD